MPLAVTHPLQARRVNPQMDWPIVRFRNPRDLYPTAPPRKGRVVGCIRSVKAVTIATSEYLSCPPGRPPGGAFQASTASSSNHTVMSPRRQSEASYPAQFFTRYFVCIRSGWTSASPGSSFSPPYPASRVLSTSNSAHAQIEGNPSHAPTPRRIDDQVQRTLPTPLRKCDFQTRRSTRQCRVVRHVQLKTHQRH